MSTWLTIMDHAIATGSWIWCASWQAAVIAVLVVFLQLAWGRWLTPSWRLAMWSVVFFRLLLPWTPPSAWSVFNLAAQLTPALPAPVVPPAPPVMHVAQTSSLFAAAPEADAPPEVPAYLFADTDSAPPTWTAARLLAALWLAGAVTSLSAVGFAALRLRQHLRSLPKCSSPALHAELAHCARLMGIRRTPRLVLAPDAQIPCLFGLLRPILILPANLPQRLDRQQMRHVLLHELAHLRRHDLLKNWCLLLLHAVHWFNPLLWYALRRYRGDRELACDALVLHHLQREEHRAYGHTLLAVLESLTGRPRFTPTIGIGENFMEVKRRLAAVVDAHRLRRWSYLGMIPLLLLIGSTLTGADPAAADKKATPPAADQDASKSDAPNALGEKGVPIPVVPDEAFAQANQEAAAKLREPITANFAENKLGNVLEFLQNQLNVNFIVDWLDLQNIGIEKDAVVTLNLTKEVPAAQALALVLRSLRSTNDAGLDFVVKEGLIRVSTAVAIQKESMYTQVYDLTSVEKTLRGTDPQNPTSDEDFQTRVRELLSTSVGRMEHWADFGGDSTVRMMNGRLIVHTYARAHQQIPVLLRMLAAGSKPVSARE